MLRLVRPVAALTVTVVALAGCAGGTTDDASAATEAATQAASAALSEGAGASADASAEASAGPSAPGATCPAEADSGDATCQVVPSTANIFGAGHSVAPAPADGGPGSVPPAWEIPTGATRMVVTDAVGSVGPVPSSRGNGPEGSGTSLGLATDVNSYGGISGIVNRSNAMFLVGVFLGDEEPMEGEHPERLGFTDKEDFTELAPLIGQTFFIGDGKGKTFVIPDGATRLFLGFVDAFDMQGDPGWYGNNSGELAVTVEFATD